MRIRFWHWATTTLYLASSACGSPPDPQKPSPLSKSKEEIQRKNHDVATPTAPLPRTEGNVNVTSGGNVGIASQPTSVATSGGSAAIATRTQIGESSVNEDDSKNQDPNQGTSIASTKTGDETRSLPSTARQNQSEGGIPELAEICGKLTERANQICKKQVSGLYQSSCNHYLKAKGPCDEQIRLALECQFKAPQDVFCAHEADHNCSKVNRVLKTCQRGTAPAEQTTDEDDRTLPSNWQKIHDEQLGFTVAMPSGAVLDTASKRRTWKREDDKVSYEVAELPPFTGKLDNQNFVRIVVGYVGSRCQLRLKLNGELPLKGTTVVQYQSGCPDGTEWRGMLHFWNGNVVSTAYRAPAGVNGVRDPFFYSFVIDNP